MKTLSEINHKYSSKEKNEDIKRLLWAIISDRWIWRSKQKFFYDQNDLNTEDVFRVIDESYFKQFKAAEWKKIQFNPNGWLIKEFFDNKPFTLNLPIFTGGNNITDDVVENFLAPMTKGWIIDDLQYTIIRNIVWALWIFYDKQARKIWFWIRQLKSRMLSWSSMINMTAKEMTLEEVLSAEISQWYVNESVGDKDHEYAYSHMLRAHWEFKLFTWAKNVIINWTKYNVIAASRGQGKTYFASMIAARELFSTKPWFGWRKYREIKYFVPDKSNIGEQVMEYVESLIGDLAYKKINNKPIIEISKSKQTAKCNVTWNVFKIVSLYNVDRWTWELWNSTWEGIACDFAIVDEAARIPDSFWSSFHQRAAFETDTFVLITTINKETPKDHWFYKLLIDWEQSDPQIKSYRITIDDNEAMKQWKTEEEYRKALEMAKNALRMQWDKEFFSKWYCIILEESNVFNTSTYLVPSNYSKYSDSDPRILWFDLGKLTDTCWLVMINLKHKEIEFSNKILNATYWTQLQNAKEYKKKYPNLLVIWDRSWVWEAVSEQDTEWIVDTWIKSTWQWELRFNRQWKFWTCPKSTIVEIMATVLNTNLLKIPADQSDLISQMNDFVKMKSWRGEVILYKGKWKTKDDLVLATAYACIYMYSILWLKKQSEIDEYVTEAWGHQIFSYADEDVYENGTWYYNGLY